MGEPQLLRHLPRRRELVAALEPLGFDFDGGRFPGRLLGFAPDGVIEVHSGPPFIVSLLFSAGTDDTSLVRGSMHVVTIASLLRLDFTPWLSDQLRRRGVETTWRAARRLGEVRIAADHLGRAAVLLTIEGPGGRA